MRTVREPSPTRDEPDAPSAPVHTCPGCGHTYRGANPDRAIFREWLRAHEACEDGGRDV